ncbi:hypothetical protein ACJIZ3_012479 [Penstemon smallii]|uniref:Uncharacterized protein n=1 Tax=Penstemon smallii TaxID=265156 RepID=A0ABD3UQS4_9LAMI
MSNPTRKKTTNDEDEVEQLLRAAQDDMLLKLSLNSHMAHSSSSAIDPDLDRRFLALKKPKQPSTTTSNHKINKIDIGGAAEGDDLFARFTALKSSLPSHSRSNLDKDESDKQTEEDENNSEEDEVEKVIKWAIDAARLDPSSPSDDDDDLDDDEFHDDDYHGVPNGKKGKKK